MCFNALSGLSCYTVQSLASAQCISFNALTGLSCYERVRIGHAENNGFNALTGLSCYGKNVQYFKFFMILFYTYLLFIGVY